MTVRHRSLAFALFLCASGAAAQEPHTGWFDRLLFGTLWRSGAAPYDADSSHIEHDIRVLLPTFIVGDLLHARPPGSMEATRDLAGLAGVVVADDASTGSATGAMIERTDRSWGIEADVAAYLRIRLFDILVGDWSRSAADLRWVRTEVGTGEVVWSPAVLPYRNAFTRFDGLVPRVIVAASDGMTSWDDDPETSVAGGYALRRLDRRLLSALPSSLWDSVAADLVMRLKGEASAEVCHRHLGLAGPSIAATLATRVARLPAATRLLYRSVTRFAEVHGTEGPDSVHVRVLSPQAVEITAVPRYGDRRMPGRVYNSLATREVRVHLKNGDDAVAYEGAGGLRFTLIFDEEDGRAATKYRRRTGDRWTSGRPPGVRFYSTPRSERYDGDDAWGSRTVLVPWADLNPDDGLFLGGGPETVWSSYRTFPYAARISLLAGGATSTGRFRVLAEAEQRDWLAGTTLSGTALYSQLNISNFFGLGNETRRTEADVAAGRSKADQRLVRATVAITAPLADGVATSVNSGLYSVRTDPRPGSLLDALIAAGFHRRLNYVSIGLGMTVDSRDHSILPTRGMFATISADLHPRALQNDDPFVRVAAATELYLHAATPGDQVLFRARWERVSGLHPWFVSSFLGGPGTLRGYERQRFAGDASVAATIEGRTSLGRLHALWPFDVGCLGFADVGRVYAAGESSRRWHGSGGAGFWVRPARSPYVLMLTLARSAEQTILYATLGTPLSGI